MDSNALWYGYKYYRSRLSEPDKGVYDAFYAGLMGGKSSFSTHFIKPKDAERIFNAVLLDAPACFHVSGFSMETSLFGCKIRPQYLIPNVQYQMECRQIESAVQTVLKAVTGKDTWATLKNLHSYILAHISYEEYGPKAHCFAGPLLLSKGVCEGIAKMVKYVCDRLGIQSAVISGVATDTTTGKDDLHAWNVIQVSGDWYCFDFTFDLTLNKSNPCASIERYDYFGLSTEEMCVDHKSEEMTFAPCSTRKDYFTATKSVVMCPSDLSALIKGRISLTKRDIAFKIGPSWRAFAPELEINKVLTLKTVFTKGAAGYLFSYNEAQRVCYIHFN